MSANEKWKLTDSEILKAAACEHQKFFIGCRAGRSSRFAVLDIDAGSKYHKKKELDRMLKALAAGGINRSTLYRSSFSEGWHLYIFFSEPINSADLRRQLGQLLTLDGFELTKGTLEVFPHPGTASAGQGLRLPLQPGWAWLDKQSLEVKYDRSSLHPTQALELFIDDLNGDANSFEDFRCLKAYVQRLASRREEVANRQTTTGGATVVSLRRLPAPTGEHTATVRTIFGDLPPGIDADLWYSGRSYHQSGLLGPSQRADAIFSLGHYFFYGDPTCGLPALGYGYEKEREWAIKDFLATRNNGYSKDISRGRPDAISQVERAAHWVPPHRRGTEASRYDAARPTSWIRANVSKKQDARKRITEALEELKKLGRSFTTVELQEAARCSRETLYKHADIWRNDYEDLAEGFFAICTDVYNAVVGADSPEIEPPPAVPAKITPPGLLAARRMAYEISMRSEREKRQDRTAAVRAQEVAEKTWRGNVTPLLKNESPGRSLQELKALLVILLGYLAMAPNEESQTFLQGHIDRLRRLVSQTENPLFLVRPP